MADAKIVLSAVDQTKVAFESAQRNLKNIGDLSGKISDLMGSVGVAIGAAFSAGSIMHLVEMLDQLDKMVEKTGIATEALSAFRYAGEIADVTQEKLGTGLRKLAKFMADAAGGNDQAALTFKTLGIEVTNADGSLRKTDEVLLDVAQHFKNWEDGPGKAAIAMRMFGKSGDDMIPMLNMGKVGLQSVAVEAQAMGAVFGGDVAKKATEFNDNLKKIKMAAEGVAISLSGPLVSALGDASRGFIEAKKSGEGYFGMLVRIANWMPQLPQGLKNSPLFPMLRIFDILQQGGTALNAPKSTVDIQAYVNKLGFGSGGAGRGWTNPQVAPPIVPDTFQNRIKPPDHFADQGLKLADSLLAQSAALSPDFYEKWDKLSAAYKGHTITVDKLVLAQAELLKQQPFEKKLLDDATKAAQSRSDLRNKEYTEINTYLQEVGNAEDKFWRDLLAATPTAQLEEQTKMAQKIHDAFMGGRYGAPDSAAAAATYGEVINTYLGNIPEAVHASKSAAEELGMSFSSAFEDAIVGGKNFSTVLQGLDQDILRIMLRKSVTEPMANYISGALGSLFTFAGGGIMSAAGPLPLLNYADGGVANRPQLALFGEGRMNEAFVPLPDGRSIPVSMKGAGRPSVVNNITINTSMGDIASKADVVAGMRATANNIVSQISRSQRYGGALT